MNVHLYRQTEIKNANLLAICPSVEDCDILHKFNWVATTVLDDANSTPVSWSARLAEEMVPQLEKKRIVLFTAPQPLSGIEAAYLISRLVDKAVDVRIVTVPKRNSVYSYLAHARSSWQAIECLEALVANAVPITSWQAFMIYEYLRETIKEIEERKELWPLRNGISRLGVNFVQLQRKLAKQRASAMD